MLEIHRRYLKTPSGKGCLMYSLCGIALNKLYNKYGTNINFMIKYSQLNHEHILTEETHSYGGVSLVIAAKLSGGETMKGFC